jgi:hypothetical protein
MTVAWVRTIARKAAAASRDRNSWVNGSNVLSTIMTPMTAITWVSPVIREEIAMTRRM